MSITQDLGLIEEIGVIIPQVPIIGQDYSIAALGIGFGLIVTVVYTGFNVEHLPDDPVGSLHIW